MVKKSFYTAICSLFLLPVTSSAESLKDILGYALVADPSLDEARANIQGAASQTKISEAGHLPVISITSTPVISQRHKYTSERRSEPSLTGRINLYSWGAVEAEIERDKHSEVYYQYKLAETREQMGQTIGAYYLSALRAKETINAYAESIKRHDKLIRDLKIIVSYDEGRQSELNEANSRRNQAETNLEQQERIMQRALSQLSRYSRRNLTPQDLEDPFKKLSTAKFTAQYKNPDIIDNPTYRAQEKEFDVAEADVRASEARRLPSIDLQASASRHEREVYVNMSWDIYNPATTHTINRNRHTQAAADARLRQIELEVNEQAQTAEIEMNRNQRLAEISYKQIALQRRVVEDFSLQFEIGMRSLLDLLNAHQELTSVQIAEINARNDFREAALLYLASQARISQWAGLTTITPLPTKSKKK